MKIDVQNYNVPDIIETEANEQMAIFQPCASSVLQTDKKEYVRAIKGEIGISLQIECKFKLYAGQNKTIFCFNEI